MFLFAFFFFFKCISYLAKKIKVKTMKPNNWIRLRRPWKIWELQAAAHNGKAFSANLLNNHIKVFFFGTIIIIIFNKGFWRIEFEKKSNYRVIKSILEVVKVLVRTLDWRCNASRNFTQHQYISARIGNMNNY